MGAPAVIRAAVTCCLAAAWGPSTAWRSISNACRGGKPVHDPAGGGARGRGTVRAGAGPEPAGGPLARTRPAPHRSAARTTGPGAGGPRRSSDRSAGPVQWPGHARDTAARSAGRRRRAAGPPCTACPYSGESRLSPSPGTLPPRGERSPAAGPSWLAGSVPGAAEIVVHLIVFAGRKADLPGSSTELPGIGTYSAAVAKPVTVRD